MRDLAYEGLDPIEPQIRRYGEEIGYLTLHEILDRTNNEQVGRIDYVTSDLGPWLGADAGDEGDDDALGDLDASDGEADLPAAAMRWIRFQAGVNMSGRTQAKFKVSLWKPKGGGVYFSARFLCRDLDEEDDPAPALTVAPTVLPPAPANDAAPEGRTWRALGDGYTHLIALLQQSYAHLAGLQNTTIGNQNAQILRLQRVLEELTGELIKLKIGLHEVDTTHRVEDGEGRIREELGKQFISELGTFGRVLAASKLGMAPELVELSEIVGASPELADALKNPEVRKMLRDENTRKELAALLTMAARGGAAPNHPPPAQETAQAA